MLVSSVLIPARLTWRILHLLRETSDVVEPARLLEAQLAFGLAEEAVALHAYAVSDDRALLAQYRTTVSEDEGRLAALERLVWQLDGDTARMSAVRSRIGEWRLQSGLVSEGHPSRAQFATAVRAQHASRDAMLHEVARLALHLADEAALRRERVATDERLSLFANASLVIVALAAVLAVAALVGREQRLAATLRRRVGEEAALRATAEALAGAFTADEVTQQIAREALAATQVRGAFVEQIGAVAGAPTDELVVRASTGSGGPAVGGSMGYAGSYTELVLQEGHPVLVPDLTHADRSCTMTTPAEPGGSAIVVPLGAPDAPIGALFILSLPQTPFRSEDLAWAGTLGHLAALAYEKVRLLDEAREGWRKLERVMQSRSRLMRGFSHDVKNPLGAADGYAALLMADIFGVLSTEQRQSVERMRRSIHSALALIDDLHELARAETGHLALSVASVDLGHLLRATGEDYRAAAAARGLSLSLDLTCGPPVVETDAERVRQIMSNLVSNAIKYTAAGSVTLRTSRDASGPEVEDASGSAWVAVHVVDTGPGIAPDKRRAIFEEFVRLDTGNTSGAGLGLAISVRLAHALGGEITLRSELGRGSTFTLWLPLRASNVSDPIERDSSGMVDRIAL